MCVFTMHLGMCVITIHLGMRVYILYCCPMQVRRLDLVQTRVQGALNKINLILDRTDCINGLQEAMDTEVRFLTSGRWKVTQGKRMEWVAVKE